MLDRVAGRESGMTLIEVAVASTVFSVIILICLEFLAVSMRFYAVDTTQVHMEWRLQSALDDLVLDLKETSPLRMQVYDFNDGLNNKAQTAVIFPTARNAADQFVYSSGGAVQAKPVWQGIVVYAFYSPMAGQPGYLCKYIDYNVGRNYDNTITITSLTSTTITLSDGTTFNRALKGTSGNQFGDWKMADFGQLVRDPEPPTAMTLPISLKLTAEQAVDELQGDSIQATSSTGIMSRNEN